MRNRKYCAIIVLLIILTGAIISSMIPKPLKKADPQTRGQTNNPPLSAVSKENNSKQVDAAASPAPVYMTQEQQDARQHKWGKPNLPEVDKARQNGAEAKVTLRVIDSRGAPVPGADIQMAFFPKDSYEAAKITKGLTDKDGLFVVSGKTVDDISFSASKTKYYATSRKFHFYWRGTDCVKNGRWQPWNPTLEVVLKEKRKPIPMFTKYSIVYLPNKDKPFGFDCHVGDLVEPYGKGKETDLFFTYSSDLSGEAERKYTNQLVIAASSVSGGIKKLKMDSWSEFRSVHNAPDGGYQPEIVFSCKSESPAIRQEVKFSNDLCLVFQSRVQTSKDGRVISANFGKIYPMRFDYGEAPPDKGHGRVEFGYYFNPTPNDRNLEFDGKNNLFKPDWKGSWPRYP